MDNKDKFFLLKIRNKLMGSEFGYFKNTQENKNTTNLLR